MAMARTASGSRPIPSARGVMSRTATLPALDGQRGELTCIAPSPGNHGPVGVRDTYHFAYADGTPHFSVGTTCYVWNHQGDALEAQTLETLRHAPFNKMRMCVFPKDYLFNKNEPEFYPFETRRRGRLGLDALQPGLLPASGAPGGRPAGAGDRGGHHPVPPLRPLGLRHDGRRDGRPHLRYVIARLAAYRNVWWSLANEYDLMQAKTMADWDRFFTHRPGVGPLRASALGAQLPRLLRSRQAVGDALQRAASRPQARAGVAGAVPQAGRGG